MKKISILLIVCLFLLPALLLAQSIEEERRFEQEKREELKASEAHALKERKALSAPIAPIDLIYFAELVPRRVTFRYDVCKALVVLIGVEDEYIGLDSQVAFLNERNFLPKGFDADFDPMQPLRKGLAAYMFCRALEIKGGLTLRLFGMSQRYAIKELAFEGIMPAGNVEDIVSGEELVSALMQATNYRAKKQQIAKVKPKE